MLNLLNIKNKKTSLLIKYFSRNQKRELLKKTQRESAETKAENTGQGISVEQAASDPAIVKLLEYGKQKKTLSYEELSDFLPEHITNSDKIEQVLALLEANNIRLVEEEDASEEDENDAPKDQESARKKAAAGSEKDPSLVDDPI